MIGTPAITANAIPQQFAAPDGKVNIWAFGFFILTGAALVYGIVNSRIQIKKAQTEDLKIKELEHNLKTLMGKDYQQIA